MDLFFYYKTYSYICKSNFKTKAMKKAILVTAILTTRIIVDENFNVYSDELNEEQLDDATGNFLTKLNNGELIDNIETIREDTEYPYDPEEDECL